MSTDYIQGYLASTDDHTRTISVNRKYIDMCDGNLPQAVLLSQIVFWHGNKRDGSPRMKVVKEGHRWIAKTPPEWHEEIGIPESTIRAAMGELVKCRLLIKKVWKFNGEKCTHIRLDLSQLELMLKNNDTVKGVSARIQQMDLLGSGKSINIDVDKDEKKKEPASKTEGGVTEDKSDTECQHERWVDSALFPGKICAECGIEQLPDTFKPPPPNGAAPPSPDTPMDHKAVTAGLCIALGVEPDNVTSWGEFNKVSQNMRQMGNPPRPEDFPLYREWDLETNPDFLSKGAGHVGKNWPRFIQWRDERRKRKQRYMVPAVPWPVFDENEPLPDEATQKKQAELSRVMMMMSEWHATPPNLRGPLVYERPDSTKNNSVSTEDSRGAVQPGSGGGPGRGRPD